jgi:hypothetical protein
LLNPRKQGKVDILFCLYSYAPKFSLINYECYRNREREGFLRIFWRYTVNGMGNNRMKCLTCAQKHIYVNGAPLLRYHWAGKKAFLLQAMKNGKHISDVIVKGSKLYNSAKSRDARRTLHAEKI